MFKGKTGSSLQVKVGAGEQQDFFLVSDSEVRSGF